MTLSQHLKRIMQMPDIQEEFAAAFLDAIPTGPAALKRAESRRADAGQACQRERYMLR